MAALAPSDPLFVTRQADHQPELAWEMFKSALRAQSVMNSEARVVPDREMVPR